MSLRSGVSVLIVREPWATRLVRGEKTLEIRGSRCLKPEGERFYIARSRSGGRVVGEVAFVRCFGPMNDSDFDAMRAEHLVEGPRMYNKTYAWEVGDAVEFAEPIAWSQPHGAVIWATVP
jgi:hypothetical protein